MQPSVYDIKFINIMINYLNRIFFTSPIKYGVKLSIDIINGKLCLRDRMDYSTSSELSLMVTDFRDHLYTIPNHNTMGNHIIVWSSKSSVPSDMLRDFKNKTGGLCIYHVHNVYIIIGHCNLYRKSEASIIDIVRASQIPPLVSTW